jgi:hypothetical protein
MADFRSTEELGVAGSWRRLCSAAPKNWTTAAWTSSVPFSRNRNSWDWLCDSGPHWAGSRRSCERGAIAGKGRQDPSGG